MREKKFASNAEARRVWRGTIDDVMKLAIAAGAGPDERRATFLLLNGWVGRANNKRAA